MYIYNLFIYFNLFFFLKFRDTLLGYDFLNVTFQILFHLDEIFRESYTCIYKADKNIICLSFLMKLKKNRVDKAFVETSNSTRWWSTRVAHCYQRLKTTALPNDVTGHNFPRVFLRFARGTLTRGTSPWDDRFMACHIYYPRMTRLLFFPLFLLFFFPLSPKRSERLDETK